jgi:hypothetical protein
MGLILTDKTVLTDINEIRKHEIKLDLKHTRNLNRYHNNGNLLTTIYDNYGPVNAYWYPSSQPDLGPIPNVNVIKSCVATHISKLSQLKPLPHFSAQLGDFETRELCKVAKIHFGSYIEKQDLYNKGAEVILYADLFEAGGFWACDDTQTIEPLKRWEMNMDPLEYATGDVSRCFTYFQQYPINKIDQKFAAITKGAAFLKTEYQKRYGHCKFSVYYDLQSGKKYYVVEDEVQKVVDIDYDCVPWAMFWYKRPVKGMYSESMADNLYPIQREIDDLSTKIHESMELHPGQMIFIAVSSDLNGPGRNLRAESFQDSTAMVYEYNPADTRVPITVATPPFIDPQFTQMLDYWITYALKQEGITQISAQGQIDPNIKSGVMLESSQNIESERFQNHQDNYRHLFNEIITICIQVMPKNALILPYLSKESGLTWGNLREHLDQMRINMTDISNLSRDPAVRLQQVEKMMAMQLISGPTAAAIMEVEDEEEAYRVGTLQIDYAQKVISDAINKGKIAYMETIDLDMLFAECVKELQKLRIDDAPKDKLANLGKLLDSVYQTRKTLQDKSKSSQVDDALEAQIGQGALQARQQEVNAQLQSQQQELQVPITKRAQDIQQELASDAQDATNSQKFAQVPVDAALAKNKQLMQPPMTQGPTNPLPITAGQPKGGPNG